MVTLKSQHCPLLFTQPDILPPPTPGTLTPKKPPLWPPLPPPPSTTDQQCPPVAKQVVPRSQPRRLPQGSAFHDAPEVAASLNPFDPAPHSKPADPAPCPPIPATLPQTNPELGGLRPRPGRGVPGSRPTARAAWRLAPGHWQGNAGGARPRSPLLSPGQGRAHLRTAGPPGPVERETPSPVGESQSRGPPFRGRDGEKQGCGAHQPPLAV